MMVVCLSSLLLLVLQLLLKFSNLASCNNVIAAVDVHESFLSMSSNGLQKDISYNSSLIYCSVYGMQLIGLENLPKLLKTKGIQHVLHNHSFLLQSDKTKDVIHIYFYYYNSTVKSIIMYLLPVSESFVQTVLCYNDLTERKKILPLEIVFYSMLITAAGLLIILLLFSSVIIIISVFDYKQWWIMSFVNFQTTNII